MAFTAAYLANHHTPTDKWSYGLHRLEPLSAFLNGILLFPMLLFILHESYQRILAPISIATTPTLIIATTGLFINLGSVYILHDNHSLSLNERGALYHLLGDTGASLAVIISTLLIRYTGLVLIDAILAILIALFIIWSALKLLKGSGEIFLHISPLNPQTVRSQLHTLPINEIIDLHLWQICSELTIATVHIHASPESIDELEQFTHDIHHELDNLGIDHATVELCRGTHCEKHQLTHSH